MTKRTLWMLIGAAGVAAGLAYAVLGRGGAGVTAAGTDAMFLPTLAARAGALTSITIADGSGEVELRKIEGGGWGVAQRGGYPADIEKVRTLVSTLAESRVAEIKTSRADQFARLGVQDVTPAGADGGTSAGASEGPRRVTLLAGGEVVASVIVGTARAGRADPNAMFTGAAPMRGEGVFARNTAAGGAVLLDRGLLVPEGPAAWLKTEALSIDGPRFVAASFEHAGTEQTPGQTLSLVRQESPSPDAPTAPDAPPPPPPPPGPFVIENMPAGRELRAAGAATPIGQLLSYVTIEDARPRAEVTGEAPAFITTATFRTGDGLVITARLLSYDGGVWALIDAAVAENTAEGDRPRITQEVSDLNGRLGAWALRLPEFKAKQFATRQEDLLKPAETAAPAAAPDTDAETPLMLRPPPPPAGLPSGPGGM